MITEHEAGDVRTLYPVDDGSRVGEVVEQVCSRCGIVLTRIVYAGEDTTPYIMNRGPYPAGARVHRSDAPQWQAMCLSSSLLTYARCLPKAERERIERAGGDLAIDMMGV